MSVKIDKKINIDDFNKARKKGKCVQYDYPVLDMEIGDSFLVPKEKCTALVKSRIYNCGYYHGIRLSILKSPCGGARVFRIK